ncbi:hypothetical protein LCGC14_1758490, partial [marine sediment metagenome]
NNIKYIKVDTTKYDFNNRNITNKIKKIFFSLAKKN